MCMSLKEGSILGVIFSLPHWCIYCSKTQFTTLRAAQTQFTIYWVNKLTCVQHNGQILSWFCWGRPPWPWFDHDLTGKWMFLYYKNVLNIRPLQPAHKHGGRYMYLALAMCCAIASASSVFNTMCSSPFAKQWWSTFSHKNKGAKHGFCPHFRAQLKPILR